MIINSFVSAVRAVKLLFSVDMLLLSITFIYTGEWAGQCPHIHTHTHTHIHIHTHTHTHAGYELNFWSGVYGTAVGKKYDCFLHMFTPPPTHTSTPPQVVLVYSPELMLGLLDFLLGLERS